MKMPLLKLKQNVSTRWNSTYDMLNMLLKIKNAVLYTLAVLSSSLQWPTPNEWAVIEKAVEILAVFYEVTVEISSEKNVSISKTIRLTKSIKQHILKVLKGNAVADEVQIMTKVLLKEMETCFSDIEDNELITVCTLLDPQFKTLGFSDKASAEKACSFLKQKISSASSTSSEAEVNAEIAGDINWSLSIISVNFVGRIWRSK